MIGKKAKDLKDANEDFMGNLLVRLYTWLIRTQCLKEEEREYKQ